MCGQFNQQVAGYALKRLDELEIPHELRRVLALGERVRSRLEESGERVPEVLSMAGSLAEVDTAMDEVLLMIDRWRSEERVETILLFHNAALSRTAHAPGLTRLLPLDPSWLRELRERRWPSRRLPLYTMDWKDLLAALTRQLLFVTLYRALVESLAAENASRLAAMQAAEQNIEDRLEELGTEFNRRRQTAITMELLDIVSGFEAIETSAG
jgi:F-type H+-transporting ATPase subunit gamma